VYLLLCVLSPSFRARGIGWKRAHAGQNQATDQSNGQHTLRCCAESFLQNVFKIDLRSPTLRALALQSR
jgi:hypothetical protein